MQESRCGRRLALRGGGGGEGVGTPRPDAEGSLGGLVEGTGLTVPRARAAEAEPADPPTDGGGAGQEFA